MAESKTKRPRGRPRLLPGEGKRCSLGIRTDAPLKAAIEAAAELSGRSVAQEIECRLWASFKVPDDILDMLVRLAAFIDAGHALDERMRLLGPDGRARLHSVLSEALLSSDEHRKQH